MNQDLDQLKIRVEALEQNLSSLSDLVVKLEAVLDEIASCILPEDQTDETN